MSIISPIEKWDEWGSNISQLEEKEDSLLMHVMIKGILLRALQFIKIPHHWNNYLTGNSDILNEILEDYYRNEKQKGRKEVLHRAIAFGISLYQHDKNYQEVFDYMLWRLLDKQSQLRFNPSHLNPETWFKDDEGRSIPPYTIPEIRYFPSYIDELQEAFNTPGDITDREAVLLYELARDADGPIVEIIKDQNKSTEAMKASGKEVITLQSGDKSPIDNISLLFIDGDRSYGSVIADWLLYAPKVKVGGVIAFHDASPGYFFDQIYPDVISVIEIIAKPPVLDNIRGLDSIVYGRRTIADPCVLKQSQKLVWVDPTKSFQENYPDY